MPRSISLRSSNLIVSCSGPAADDAFLDAFRSTLYHLASTYLVMGDQRRLVHSTMIGHCLLSLDVSAWLGVGAPSARMDPEDLREVISAYQNSVAETVGRFGGFVAKYRNGRLQTWIDVFRHAPICLIAFEGRIERLWPG
jgi:hypothetical protein